MIACRAPPEADERACRCRQRHGEEGGGRDRQTDPVGEYADSVADASSTTADAATTSAVIITRLSGDYLPGRHLSCRIEVPRCGDTNPVGRGCRLHSSDDRD